MKRLLLTLMAAAGLVTAAHADNDAIASATNLFVTYTKEDCKTMESCLEDHDFDGWKGLNADGKLDMIRAGDRFYVSAIGMWDGVDTLRWHNRVCYIPNRILAPLLGNN
jgi:hypothetical protein